MNYTDFKLPKQKLMSSISDKVNKYYFSKSKIWQKLEKKLNHFFALKALHNILGTNLPFSLSSTHRSPIFP